jgi:uncharacterized protein with HEPN domain
MPKREMKLLLQDIIENSEMIFQFVGSDSYEEFVINKMKVYAVVRAFEIIGEASKIISPDVKSAYPLIEWQLMTDFRNLLSHHYFGIEYEILWKTIKESLPYNYEMLKQVSL